MRAYKTLLNATSPGKLKNFDSELKAVIDKKNDIRFT